MTLLSRAFQSPIAKSIGLMTTALAMTFVPASSANAASKSTFEVTPYIGYMAASDLQSPDGTSTLKVDSASHFGIGIAWQDSPKGQGQVLVNAVSHNFEGVEANSKHSLDIIYAHFNGVAQFRQNAYVTTFSLGVGGAYFDSQQSTTMAPSATAAIGTRYEFSNSFALVTEVRAYASLVDEDDELFCENDACAAQFDGSIFMEGALSFGIAYRF